MPLAVRSIAAGAMIVAMGGTLTRFGHREYLYLAMAAGRGRHLRWGSFSPVRRNQEDALSQGRDAQADRTLPITALPLRARSGRRRSTKAFATWSTTCCRSTSGSSRPACRRWSADAGARRRPYARAGEASVVSPARFAG